MRPNPNPPFSFPVTDEMFKTSKWTGGVICRCVEVAKTHQGVAIRDSKDPAKQTLFFTNDEFLAFTRGVKEGEFD